MERYRLFIQPRVQLLVSEDTLKVVGKEDSEVRKQQLPPASNAFVPSVAGLIAASYVVRELTKSIPIRRKGQ